MLEKKIKQLVRNTYYAANPRIAFTSKPLITPGGKDPVSKLNKSMVIYQYSCCCTASYIGLTTRHLRKRIKIHIPKCVENFCLSDKKDYIPITVLNASKRSYISEHLVNNPTFANNYNIDRFKLLKFVAMFLI